MQTKVSDDYIEVSLTGFPFNPRNDYKDPNATLQNVYTGTVLDVPSTMPSLSIDDRILFAKLFKLVVSEDEIKYYVHKNAVIAKITS